LEKTKTFITNYRKYYTKLTKSDNILFSGDLNGRIENVENHNILGSSGEPVTNTNGLRLRDFATYNNLKIMNSFYKHKNIHTYIQSTCNSKTVIDYFTANRNLSELFLDFRVHRGSDVGSGYFLTLVKLRIPTKWWNAALKENIVHCKIR